MFSFYGFKPKWGMTMKCRGMPIEPLPPELWYRDPEDPGRHLYDPLVSSMARSVLSAMQNGDIYHIRTFSKGLLAVIASSARLGLRPGLSIKFVTLWLLSNRYGCSPSNWWQA